MPKYKPGDRVLVISNPVMGQIYYMEDGSVRDSFVPSMLDFAGKIVTIKHAGVKYRLLEDACCNWTDDMFVGLALPEATVDKHPNSDFSETNKSKNDLLSLYRGEKNECK